MPSVNPGPASTTQVNTQSPYSTELTIQTIAVSLTPVAIGAAGASEQSFGLNGVTQVTAATGIKAGDVILSISPPGVAAGSAPVTARGDASVDDKFYVTFIATAASTPTAGTYLVTVGRINQSTKAPGAAYSTLPSTVQ